LAKHNSLIINTKILPDKYPLCASAGFYSANLAKQYQPDEPASFTDKLVNSFNKNLTKNTWIIFWWIKI
jgi:hypothetical protein